MEQLKYILSIIEGNETVFLITIHVVTSVSLYIIAKKMKHDLSWIAFIPVLNMYLICSLWWYWFFKFFVYFLLAVAFGVSSNYIPGTWAVTIIILMLTSFQLWQRTLWIWIISLIAWVFPPVWYPLIAIWMMFKHKKIKAKHSIREQKLREIEERRIKKMLHIIECESCWMELKLKQWVKASKWKCPKCWDLIII